MNADIEIAPERPFSAASTGGEVQATLKLVSHWATTVGPESPKARLARGWGRKPEPTRMTRVPPS